MEVINVAFAPKYTRGNGVFVLDASSAPLPPEFPLKEPSLVHIPPKQVAGNHRHLRQEAFVCFQPGVELHWLDQNGAKHTEQMAGPNNTARLFIVPSQVPHAVVNTTDVPTMLAAFADGPLVDAVAMDVA